MSRCQRTTAVQVTLCLLILLGGCAYKTTAGITGDRTFHATFDDVQHLVVGHTVRLSDVGVGTVTSVDLDGFDAVIDFKVENGRDLPMGTTASISATSLLGENYVRLTLPDDPGADLYEDGDEIPTDGTDASFEELTLKLLTLLRAINGRDVATIVDSGAEAFGGRGPQLRELITTVGDVTDGLTTQSADLIDIVDSVAGAGEVLVADIGSITNAIDQVAEATGVLARQRDRVVETLADLTAGAKTLNSEVLIPRRAQLDRILDRLDPIAEVLAANRGKVVELLEALRIANTVLPRAIDRDEVLAYAIFDRFVLPAGLGTLNLGQVLPLSGADAVTAMLSPRSPLDQIEALLSPVAPSPAVTP